MITSYNELVSLKKKIFNIEQQTKNKQIHLRRKYNNHVKLRGGGKEDIYTAIKEGFVHFPNLLIQPLSNKDYVSMSHKLNSNIPETNMTYMTLFSHLSNDFTQFIFIVGGFVRDYVQTNKIPESDVDINFTIPINELSDTLSTLNIFKKEQYNYIRKGDVEGFYLDLKNHKPENLECKVNSLLLLITKTNMYLIDLFGGEGIQHAKNRMWDAPVDDLELWKRHKCLLWRMLKFQERGYTVPNRIKKDIYTFWIYEPEKISNYHWNNIWWEHNPKKLEDLFRIIEKDCKDLQLDFSKLVLSLIHHKCIVANKH